MLDYDSFPEFIKDIWRRFLNEYSFWE